jgi:hypothetical protein
MFGDQVERRHTFRIFFKVSERGSKGAMNQEVNLTFINARHHKDRTNERTTKGNFNTLQPLLNARSISARLGAAPRESTSLRTS